MKILDRGLVYAGEQGSDRQSNIAPGVCVLPNGRWVCGFRSAPDKGGTVQQALVTWSDDHGQTWHPASAPFEAPAIDGRPGMLRTVYPTALGGNRVLATVLWVDHSDPSLPFFNEETEGLLDMKIFFATSEDGGETWSPLWLMDTTPFDQPTPGTGPTLILQDGTWACQFELNKHYYEPETWRHSAVLMFSRDEGKTWGEPSITANDPENRLFYWDQRPAVLSDGTVLDVFWTYDNQAAKYLNIHARESKDGGHTWSELWDCGFPDQPAPPVSLPDGRIALVYVDRTGAPAIKLRTSVDGGRTWPAETELVLYADEPKSQTWKKGAMQDAWAEMGKFSVGLPATALTPEGDLLVVYYAGPETDFTAINWVRVSA